MPDEDLMRGFTGTDEGKHADARRVDRAAAGRTGGEAVSRDLQHLAEIGRTGGLAVARDREHMAEIGRKGGEARGRRRG